MKLIGQKPEVEGEFIKAPETFTLDELYDRASAFGKVTIGGSFRGPGSAEISCQFTGDDYVNIRCDRYPTVHQNLLDVIQRATDMQRFYRARLR